MSLLDHFRKPAAPPQQSVIVTLRRELIDMETSGYEDSDLSELEDQLTEALADADAGDFWENEFLPQQVSSTFTGPDAERMFTAMQPVLRASRLGRQAHVTLRQGEAGAPQREVQIA